MADQEFVQAAEKCEGGRYNQIVEDFSLDDNTLYEAMAKIEDQ